MVILPAAFIIAAAVAVVPIPVLAIESGAGNVTVGAVVNPLPLAVTVTIPKVLSLMKLVAATPEPFPVLVNSTPGTTVYPAPGLII